MIFQDPFGSLNPVHTIYHHIARPLQIHKRADNAAIPKLVFELLELVGLSPAKETAENTRTSSAVVSVSASRLRVPSLLTRK